MSVDILGTSCDQCRSTVQKIFTSTETIIRFIRDGENGGKGVWRWGKMESIYVSLLCHHQNDFCIKMGSDESHFNVFINCEGQNHKTVSTNHNF